MNLHYQFDDLILDNLAELLELEKDCLYVDKYSKVLFYLYYKDEKIGTFQNYFYNRENNTASYYLFINKNVSKKQEYKIYKFINDSMSVLKAFNAEDKFSVQSNNIKFVNYNLSKEKNNFIDYPFSFTNKTFKMTYCFNSFYIINSSNQIEEKFIFSIYNDYDIMEYDLENYYIFDYEFIKHKGRYSFHKDNNELLSESELSILIEKIKPIISYDLYCTAMEELNIEIPSEKDFSLNVKEYMAILDMNIT